MKKINGLFVDLSWVRWYHLWNSRIADLEEASHHRWSASMDRRYRKEDRSRLISLREAAEALRRKKENSRPVTF